MRRVLVSRRATDRPHKERRLGYLRQRLEPGIYHSLTTLYEPRLSTARSTISTNTFDTQPPLDDKHHGQLRLCLLQHVQLRLQLQLRQLPCSWPFSLACVESLACANLCPSINKRFNLPSCSGALA